MMAIDWILWAAQIWLAGSWFALFWYDGAIRQALAWPGHLLDHLIGRHLDADEMRLVHWGLVTVAVLRTFNII